MTLDETAFRRQQKLSVKDLINKTNGDVMYDAEWKLEVIFDKKIVYWQRKQRLTMWKFLFGIKEMILFCFLRNMGKMLILNAIMEK